MQRGFTLVELLVVIVIIALLAGLLIPAIVKALCNARNAGVEKEIQALTMCVVAYELDMNVYPPGDGTGTDQMVTALMQPGPKGTPYLMDVQPEELLNGHFRNKAVPTEFLYYRPNQPNPPVTARNKGTFDIWGSDCFGDPVGVNNW